MILILSSPSGAGKTTLTRMLLQDKNLDLTLSISVTTRTRRSSEADGIHYHFITRPQYDRMKGAGDLLEAAEVHGNGYGTPRAPVEAALEAGRDVLFDIDWQGAATVAAALPKDTVRLFILPPTMEALSARLHGRAQDAHDVIARRLARARGEIARWRDYDYVIVNDAFERAYAEIEAIYLAERLRRERNLWLDRFVDDLTGEI